MRAYHQLKTKLEKNGTTVTALELKQLLILLMKNRRICLRFRLIGEMWTRNFMQVSAVNEKTVLLFDELENRYHMVRYNSIMQFEIDERFQAYQPHFHYNLQPSPELE